MNPSSPRRVLVLCTGNSCRSQMAEAWINHDLAGQWLASSAGTQPAENVHPLATRVMSEAGVPLDGARPKSVDTLVDEPFDLVVTVCDDARQSCPVFPRAVPKLHIAFTDPATIGGSEAERLAVFRSVRDDIRKRLVPAVAAHG